jgi:hypothetical protein
MLLLVMLGALFTGIFGNLVTGKFSIMNTVIHRFCG